MQKLSDTFFPDINVEFQSEGLIRLTQFSVEENVSVEIHPVHLRFMAEKFGLVEASDLQTARTIARLSRQLLALNERIQHLDDWLSNRSDGAHANLDYEQSYAGATADIAREFCADLADAEPQDVVPTCEPSPPARTSHPANVVTSPPVGKQPVESQPKLI